MEIHGQLNVRVMLWYKSVSLLLPKLVRTVTSFAARIKKKKKIQNQQCLKKPSISFLFEGFMVVSILLLLSPAFPLVPL